MFSRMLLLLAGMVFTASLVLLCALPVGATSALAVAVFTVLAGVLTHMYSLAHRAEELSRQTGATA